MTPALLDLARELVALPGWAWRPGMRWIAERGRGLEPVVGRVVEGRRVLADGVYPGAIPDLSDPATLGAMLGLVRGLADCPWLSVVGGMEGWRVAAEDGPWWVTGLPVFDAEAPAIVAALRAAEATP